MTVFLPEALAKFAGCYPETPRKLAHLLRQHPLLELEALAHLAEALPAASVEYNLGDLPIGMAGKPPRPDATAAETIRDIGASGSWVVLQRVEQVAEYAELLETLCEELRPRIEATTGRIMMIQGFIFVTSPGGVVPFHFDPEHNILLQLRGSKVLTLFPAGEEAFANDEAHELFHADGHYLLSWNDRMAAGGRAWDLAPGDALYVPVKAPHHVRNGPEVSISLSITWRSEWSFDEADARSFNAVLRRWGVRPRSTLRWPARNLGKAYGYRVLRKLGAAR